MQNEASPHAYNLSPHRHMKSLMNKLLYKTIGEVTPGNYTAHFFSSDNKKQISIFIQIPEFSDTPGLTLENFVNDIYLNIEKAFSGRECDYSKMKLVRTK